MNRKGNWKIINSAIFACSGFYLAFAEEKSFRLECFLCLLETVVICFIDVTNTNRILVIISLLSILVVELINSAIENVGDLVTDDFHRLAKRAKDYGAAAVMVSFVIHVYAWWHVLSGDLCC